jgi:hypothetical protein
LRRFCSPTTVFDPTSATSHVQYINFPQKSASLLIPSLDFKWLQRTLLDSQRHVSVVHPMKPCVQQLFCTLAFVSPRISPSGLKGFWAHLPDLKATHPSIFSFPQDPPNSLSPNLK